MFQRGGFKVLVRRQAKYEVEVNDEKTILVTPAPQQLFPRTLGHSSLYAHIAIQKFALGVPHHRLEKHLEGQGEPLDRGTMGRWMEDLGNTLGATIVHAMFRDAIENCSVLSTDATGAAIQPEPNGKKQKRACRKGHFFTIVADARHVLFAYTNSHSQDFVAKLFHGFRGLIQSDASSVYDILDRGSPLDDGEQPVALVGCWAHCRRYFFDAAVVRYPVGVEGLTYIQAIYRADMALSGLPPSKRKRLREERVLPLVERFYAWVHQAVRSRRVVAPLPVPSTTRSTKSRSSVVSSSMGASLSITPAANERFVPSSWVGRRGCSTAATCMPRLPRPSSPSSPPVGSTASTPRRTSTTSFASCLSGPASGTSSWLP